MATKGPLQIRILENLKIENLWISSIVSTFSHFETAITEHINEKNNTCQVHSIDKLLFAGQAQLITPGILTSSKYALTCRRKDSFDINTQLMIMSLGCTIQALVASGLMFASALARTATGRQEQWGWTLWPLRDSLFQSVVIIYEECFEMN